MNVAALPDLVAKSIVVVEMFSIITWPQGTTCSKDCVTLWEGASHTKSPPYQV